MKKNIINKIMTGLSLVYLVYFICLQIFNERLGENFNWLDGDALLIIGAIHTLLEIVLSNRNSISKAINQRIFRNKLISYEVLISLSECTLSIEKIIDGLEKSLSDGLASIELKRKPISKYCKQRWDVYYEDINCQITCSADYCDTEKTKEYSLKIAGTNKYGDISLRGKSVLYFATLIKLLGNNFLAKQPIMNECKVEKIDVIIKWEGSEIKPTELLGDKVKKVEEFFIKTSEGFTKEEEVIINKNEIVWSTLNSRSLMDGFSSFTDIMSSIV